MALTKRNQANLNDRWNIHEAIMKRTELCVL